MEARKEREWHALGGVRMAEMIDVSGKVDVKRTAKACGIIKLKKETVKEILKGKVKKGDVISVSKVAAIQAVKNTPQLLPLCHPIPITDVRVDIEVGEDAV